MGNYYQHYFNDRAGRTRKNKSLSYIPGSITNTAIKDHMRNGKGSLSQRDYHSHLIKFLEDHNVEVSFIKRPVNSKDCSRCIHTAFTLMKKAGIYEEYMQMQAEKQAIQ